MSCISQILALKGDKEFLPVHDGVVIEGGGIYKGHEYLIVFTDMGHRCGYVALLSEEVDETNECIDGDGVACHGGITFCSREHAAKQLLPIPCNDMWVGFDAGHAFDQPCHETAKKYFGQVLRRLVEYTDLIYPEDWTHKTYEYMEKECHAIIEQLI